MDRKTENAYDAMWLAIFNIVPELQNNVKSYISDFERAQINSARKNFPEARVSGCEFHYRQVSLTIFFLFFILLKAFFLFLFKFSLVFD